MLKNIFKTIVIFIFSVTVFGFIFVFLYKNEGAVFYGVNLSFDKVSSIPDIFNSIIGIPITVAGTLLALTLAKVAYEITEKEFNRDNLLIFTEKYENYYKSFSGISISINKIVYLSSYFFHEYEILMMNMAQADRYGDDTKDYYGEFYKHLKSELNICGFFEELKRLEEYFTLLQSQPVLSSFFEKKSGHSLHEIIAAIRQWGHIPNVYGTSENHKGQCIVEIISSYINVMRLDNEKTFFNTGVDYIYNGNIDINIDVDKFSLAFFGSQLYSNKFPLIEKTEDDYEKAYSRQCRDNHNPPQSSKSDHISFLKYEDKKYGTKKQYINILGLNLLSDIINSMPCNEEIISMISETIVVNSRYTNKIDQANPSNMISYEKEIINKMINLLEYTPEIYLREVNEGEQKTIKVLRNHYVN